MIYIMTTDVLDKSNDIEQNQMNKSTACSHHGNNCANQAFPGSACTDVCKLCLYTGGGNVMFDSIIAFVVEKSSEIHFDVLIAQVQAELRDKCVQVREALRLAAYARDRDEERDHATARASARLGLHTEPTQEETQDGAGVRCVVATPYRGESCACEVESEGVL